MAFRNKSNIEEDRRRRPERRINNDMVFWFFLLWPCPLVASLSECEAWAREGECRLNWKFMLEECRDACVRAAPWGVSPEYPECRKWALEDHECTRNLAFMNLQCADDCGHMWRWVPEVRSALGLVPVPVVPRKKTTSSSSGTSLDALAAAQYQCETLESLVLQGVAPVILPEDSRSLAKGIFGTYLYATRLLKNDDLISFALSALAIDDHDRRDWAFRSLPNFILRLRKEIDKYESLYLEPKRRTLAQKQGKEISGLLKNISMPVLGLGTCWLDETQTENAVARVVKFLEKHPEHPGVHIDSAEAYNNEKAIGRALSSTDRIFLASKLSDEKWLSYEGARRRVDDSLQNFKTKTIDLYSLHSPFGFRSSFKNRQRLREAWRGLVSCVVEGKVRALGISNFDDLDLQDFISDPHLGQLMMPSVLQNKFDIYRQGEQVPTRGGDVVHTAELNDIALVAYSSLSGWPFGFGALADPFVHQLANHYNVSPATLVLRWVLAKGHAIIPRTSNPDHIDTNLQLLTDFPLLPSVLSDVLDGLAFLAATDKSFPETIGAFDSFRVFSEGDQRPPPDL